MQLIAIAVLSISINYIVCNGESCVCQVSTRAECESAGTLKYAPDGTIKSQCTWQTSHKKCRNTNWLECKQNKNCIWIPKVADEVENNIYPPIAPIESNESTEVVTSRLMNPINNSGPTEIDENESFDVNENESLHVDDDDNEFLDVGDDEPDDYEPFDVGYIYNDPDANRLINIPDDPTFDLAESPQKSQADESVIQNNESGDFEDNTSAEIEENEPTARESQCPVDQQGDDAFGDDAENNQMNRQQNEEIVMLSIQTQAVNVRIITLFMVIIVGICGGIYHFSMKKKKGDALFGLNQYKNYNYSTF